MFSKWGNRYLFQLFLMKILITLVLLTAIYLAQGVEPPVWPQRFQESFVETFNTTKIAFPGKYYYDSNRGYTRLDRTDGRFDRICGSIAPNRATPCTILIRDLKRYIIFPELRYCCMCCDAAHGCGILSRNWLKTAKYEGEELLVGEKFNKWSIPDGGLMDYYYARQNDQQTPRLLVTQSYMDFIMNTYSEEEAPESLFALPSYCTATCPSTTFCGKFQSQSQVSEE